MTIIQMVPHKCFISELITSNQMPTWLHFKFLLYILHLFSFTFLLQHDSHVYLILKHWCFNRISISCSLLHFFHVKFVFVFMFQGNLYLIYIKPFCMRMSSRCLFSNVWRALFTNRLWKHISFLWKNSKLLLKVLI